jgi:hypothetical protein
MEVYIVFQQHEDWSRVMGVYYTLQDAKDCLDRWADAAKEQAHAQWGKDGGHGRPTTLLLTDVRDNVTDGFYVEGPIKVKGTPLRALAEQAE